MHDLELYSNSKYGQFFMLYPKDPLLVGGAQSPNVGSRFRSRLCVCARLLESASQVMSALECSVPFKICMISPSIQCLGF